MSLLLLFPSTSVTVTGTGDLQAQNAQISGAGEVTHTGTGDLQSQASAISGSGAVLGTISGTGDLACADSQITGTGLRITTVTGTGDLQAQSSHISGEQEGETEGGWSSERWDWARQPDYKRLRKELEEKEQELLDAEVEEKPEIKEEIEEILEEIDDLPVDNQLALYLDLADREITQPVLPPVVEKEYTEKKEAYSQEVYLEKINKTLLDQNDLLMKQMKVMENTLKELQKTQEEKDKDEEKEIFEIMLQMADL